MNFNKSKPILIINFQIKFVKYEIKQTTYQSGSVDCKALFCIHINQINFHGLHNCIWLNTNFALYFLYKHLTAMQNTILTKINWSA